MGEGGGVYGGHIHCMFFGKTCQGRRRVSCSAALLHSGLPKCNDCSVMTTKPCEDQPGDQLPALEICSREKSLHLEHLKENLSLAAPVDLLTNVFSPTVICLAQDFKESVIEELF
ncbi:Leucyl/phenylalanyl-tRNA--protein transferase [Clarias magur]|uniref:Leucyl/phenylalanyl-tRNA--protein transferase n=1 Tax=Clarias magur TaxID=1594786 RepID=A0A8J4TPC5_CLAMG|nr:Leucyl/phenylalanyl-tRNA--protein transferase [Clarias magur]